MELVKVSILLQFFLQVFNGNTDRNTVVINNVTYPFVAKPIRFVPLEWKDHICMRAEIFGCSLEGENELSVTLFRPCVITTPVVKWILSTMDTVGKSRKCRSKPFERFVWRGRGGGGGGPQKPRLQKTSVAYFNIT